MKNEFIRQLADWEKDLRSLKKEISALKVETVNKVSHRNLAIKVADNWVEKLRSPLEHRFNLPKETISQTSDLIKQLHILSRPSNHKSSYLKVLTPLISKFKDKFTLPVQQTNLSIEKVLDLRNLIVESDNPEESEYLEEAIMCAEQGFIRASLVMGWCAAIDRIQKKIESTGFSKFNDASIIMKNKGGQFKRWNKEYKLKTLTDLQDGVFDKDLLVVLVGLDLLDSNQYKRMLVNYGYRCDCAHPSSAPIEEEHLIAYYKDLKEIIFSNNDFSV